MIQKKHVEKQRRRKIDVSRFMDKLRQSEEGSIDFDPLEWILLFLYAANGRIPSKIHIQKSLLMASKYIEELEKLLEFKAYRMGPWSEEVNDALEIALVNGLISVTSKNEPILTDSGFVKASDLWSKLNERYREILTKIARFVSNMSVDELLLYIYTVHGYTEKSDVVDKLFRRRKELAISMLRKGLISTELAAKIAGETLSSFIEYLKRRGVKPFDVEVNDIEEAKKL